MKELDFEKDLIQHLSQERKLNEKIAIAGESAPNTKSSSFRDVGDYVVKTKMWKYEPSIKTTEALWKNFKEIT